MGALQHFLVKQQNHVVIRIVTFGFYSHRDKLELQRVGSDYGGWWVPKHIIEAGSRKKIIISAGLGKDVTFDKAILDCGCQVIGLDPLLDSYKYAIAELGKFKGFTAINKGLWIHTGIEKFFPPKNVTHDSWSTVNLQKTAPDSFEYFDVISLDDLILEFPQVLESDYSILKMDIEGSEFHLINALCSSRFSFDFLAIEMDFLSLIPFRNIRERIRMIIEARGMLKNLRSIGYDLVKTENFNYFWVKR